MIDPSDLDQGQYTVEHIVEYEKVYGRDFVSPGGRETAARFVAMLELEPGARVLDAGCGLGGSAFLMASEHRVQVLALDLSRNMVALARERCAAHGLEAAVEIVHGDVLELDARGEFDAVYSRDVFLHIHDKRRAFGALHRALKPGGRLLVTDYCAGAGPRSEDFAEYVRGRSYDLHTVAAYATLLEEAGFENVRGEDLSAEFLRIQRAELAHLAHAGLDAAALERLDAHWRAKIARTERGEQRWGLFTARRGGAPERRARDTGRPRRGLAP
jgi:phosphoethanolamine N-methyltransferase